MLSFLNTYLLGRVVPVGLILAGIFFLFYLRGYPLRKLSVMLRVLGKKPAGDGISPFRAVTLALAGTLGVGNIVGVAGAILLGGPGSIFWMWVCALAAIILKYAEVVLAVTHRRTREDGSHYGGAFYYMKDYFRSKGFPKLAVFCSVGFAVLCILNSLSMGCVVQVNAVSRSFLGTANIPVTLTGGILAILTYLVIVTGTKGIAALTEKLVPLMTVLYVLLSVAVIVLCREGVGEVFRSILEDAFSFRSASGGIVGFFTCRALRYGSMRGLVSNEAGCGTAPTAHAAAQTDSAPEQGFWGVVEVFIDTIVLCTVSAVVLLLQYQNPEVAECAPDGMLMSIRAYSTVLGQWSEYVIAAAVLFFGFATLICWANYGMECISFLSPKPFWKHLYIFVFCGCVLIGALAAPESVWGLADFAIGAMTVLNVGVLMLMRKEIREQTFVYFGCRQSRSGKRLSAHIKNGSAQ